MITEKSVKELENSQAALTLTLDAASIEEAYSKRLQKYAKDLTIPGFRKGKAPSSVIERKFGDQIREESTFDAMEEALKEAYASLDKKDMPLVFSTPVLQDEEKLLPFKKDSDLTFTVVYDVMPRFDLPSYTGLEVEVPSIEVTDADIEKEIEKYREQNAIVRTKDGEAKSGDIATIDYVELDAEGNEAEHTKRDGFTFTLGSGYNFYKLDKDIEGMKAGDEKTVTKSYTEEDNIPGYAGKTITLRVKLTTLKERELPAVDDDFAQDVKEEYKTVADLKAGIRERLQKNADDAAKREKEDAIMAKLASEVSIAIPASMLQAELDNRWRGFVRQMGVTEEQLEKFMQMQGSTKEAIQNEWKEDAEKTIKTQLIMDRIREKEDFEIPEEELNAECEKQLKNVPDSEKDSYKDMIKDEMQFAKVLPYLIENNTFKEGEKKSYGDYMGL